MIKKIRLTLFTLVFGLAALIAATSVSADEWPLVSGDYWEVTGVDIKDGGDLKYATWLADEWRKNSDFAVSKGWIKGYKLFGNVNGRVGEPDLYLVRIIETVVSGAEGEKRADEYQEWRKKSFEQMESESGNRATYREVMSSVLLQELTFRN